MRYSGIHHVVIFLGLMLPALVAAETLIASVDLSRLMQEAPQAKVATDNLKASFSERERSLLAENEEIRRLESEFNQLSPEITRAEADALELDIREKRRELKRKSEVFNEDFSLARNEALKNIQEDVYRAIVDVAETRKYDLVFSENVLYASERVDITDLVLQRLQELE